MSGPRGEFKRGTVFSPQVLATVSPGSQRFPGKRFLVRRWTRAQCLHRESAQQGKVRLLSTKMDCNLPPLMREEQHVSTRSLTPLLMLENPEDLLLGSTFKRWPELPAGFLGECAHDMGPAKAENRAYIIAAILPGTAGALRVRGVSRALVLGPGTTEGDANREEVQSVSAVIALTSSCNSWSAKKDVKTEFRKSSHLAQFPSSSGAGFEYREGPLSPGLMSAGQGPAFHMASLSVKKQGWQLQTSPPIPPREGASPSGELGCGLDDDETVMTCHTCLVELEGLEMKPGYHDQQESWTGPFDSGTRPLYVALASLGRADPPMAADFLCIWC
ncbi:hypothetical protein MJG53_017036 [Ovis ammon polii x Ovis aries]|uniref:Uncharacterized protein n=1 Tax=Ovis ammon polii x Ovis aries TaxID=2918886 RepID=A0ACB9UA95_9CETA|nr:hypothetical protein MJG53_017036 [Ovis ammon polii x Ovis aries]